MNPGNNIGFEESTGNIEITSVEANHVDFLIPYIGTSVSYIKVFSELAQHHTECFP